MLGPLRSPPPAANWNQANSTALFVMCTYWYNYIIRRFLLLYPILHAWMWRAGCFALGDKGRIECTHHLWCRYVT